MRQDIFDSVSTIRNIFVHLSNSGEEQTRKIDQLLGELTKAREELQESRVTNLPGSALPYRGGGGHATSIAAHHQPTPSRRSNKLTTGPTPHQLTQGDGPRKLYSEVVSERVDKRFKLMVKSKLELSSEEVKKVLRTKVNPTAIKVGIKTLKSLKDGRVLIEAGTTDEINKLSQAIQDKCGRELEVTTPQLRKPRMIINNIPNDITVENLEETIIAQNPELELVPVEIGTKFIFSTKWGQTKGVIEVGPETRRKLQQKKLKIGWQICLVTDHLIAIRCYNCSRFNHRQTECKREETCPLCAGRHKLKECKASVDQHKCVNCVIYNQYNKIGKIREDHTSLDKNCPSLQAVLEKYRHNTDY